MIGLVKGTGILVLVCDVIWSGFCIAAEYKKRVIFWEQMTALCGFLQNEIRYTADRISDIFLRFDWQNTEWNQEISYFDFEQTVWQMVQELKLDHKEEQWLMGFYRGLGTTDLEGQLSHLATYGRVFEQRLNVAQEQYAAKGKLYRSLAVLGGLMIGVLLI